MNKNTGKDTINEIKQMRKDKRQSSISFVWTITSRLIFGIGSLVTSTLALCQVMGWNVTVTGYWAIAAKVCIAVTLVPAVLATGKYLWDGMTNDVRKEIK